MKLEFVGPASLLETGDVFYPAVLDGKDLKCSFSYEALQDLDPEGVETNVLELFKTHQLKLLSIVEQKILNGHAVDGAVHLFSHDLVLD
ncbi:DUF1488 family protein [Polynucleobacter hallstattensis]|jgi:hypothetical protein|uniref:DUF1488 family protein n=1 Tax=Polynucleobacter hallstattensis TaxID=1855586 RepID=UPI001C0BF058|nr:DUF1488 family protein [Polynucleobacter hallstattensis]MBU3562127.1 DUF1488 family protein [Polynucleobacter hallstattensis]